MDSIVASPLFKSLFYHFSHVLIEIEIQISIVIKGYLRCTTGTSQNVSFTQVTNFVEKLCSVFLTIP